MAKLTFFILLLIAISCAVANCWQIPTETPADVQSSVDQDWNNIPDLKVEDWYARWIFPHRPPRPFPRRPFLPPYAWLHRPWPRHPRIPYPALPRLPWPTRNLYPAHLPWPTNPSPIPQSPMSSLPLPTQTGQIPQPPMPSLPLPTQTGQIPQPPMPSLPLPPKTSPTGRKLPPWLFTRESLPSQWGPHEHSEDVVN